MRRSSYCLPAAGRSRLYQLLALAFAFPDEDFYQAVRGGEFAAALTDACTALPYDVTDALTAELGVVPAAYTDFESEYIRLFDVGAAGPWAGLLVAIPAQP